MSDQKYCKSAQQVSKQQQQQQQLLHQQQQQQLHHQHLVRVDTPVTPPPPIPRRQLMRAKCAWQPSSLGSTDMSCTDVLPPAPTTTTTSGSSSTAGSVFVYPQPSTDVGVGGVAGQSALLVDIAARPSAYADADGISDDDRMSLENSVFDESLTSTPVKVAAMATRYHVAAKRAQRSSSSTVDSAYGGSSTGGHSERFASSSTSVDFRSRFSSVDTQSSLDEKAMSGSIDSPLAKDTSRLERAALNDVMHKLNNNLYANNNSNNSAINHSNNNNQMGNNKLPTVPARKLPQLPQKLPPPPTAATAPAPPAMSSHSVHNSSSDCSKESTSSVSASASTSSAGSGSSTISSTTMSSTSVSGAVQKRPGPPEPPQRAQHLNSFELSMEAASGMAKVHAPPPLTVRNKLNRNKPPPIVYPKMQQRQDSTLSSDSYSISSSPGYNSKMMETPLLAAAQTSRKSAAPGRQPLMDLPSSRLGQSTPGRGKMNFRQDSTISSDSFSQTSSPGYNPKLMEAPLLPSLSAKRLCSGKWGKGVSLARITIISIYSQPLRPLSAVRACSTSPLRSWSRRKRCRR